MLKNQIFIFISSYLIGIWIAALLWNFLVLPFSNPMELLAISGELPQGFNPANNVIRYLAVILLPSFLYIVSFQFFKKKIITIQPVFDLKENRTLLLINQGLFFLFFLFMIYFFIKYIPNRNNPFLKMDHFHEGEVLSPAFNYILSGKIWSGQLFAHGAFYDVLFPALSSYFFGDLTIAHLRVFNLIQYQSARIVFCLIMLFILYRSIVPFNKQKYYFLVSFIFFFYILTIDQFYFIEKRDFFFFIGLLTIVLSLRWNFFIFFSGFYTSIALVNSIDRGVYYTCILLFLFGYFYFVKNYKKLIIGLLGLFIGFIVFYLTVGKTEFKYFIYNTFFMLKIKDLNDAFVLHFPTRIGFGNFKNFIINISSFCLLINVSVFLYNKNFIKKNWFILGCIFTISSIVFLRSAIARSDDYHFAYVSLWTFIAFFYWSSLFAFKVLNKKLVTLLTSFLCILGVGFIWSQINSSLYMISPLVQKGSYEEFKNLPDAYFFEEDKKMELQALIPSFENESCVFNLSFNPSWPFHLKKPSCSYCYMPWFCSAKIKRELVLNEIIQTNPSKILLEFPIIGMQKTMGEVIDYVLHHFEECSQRSLPEESRVRVYCKKE